MSPENLVNVKGKLRKPLKKITNQKSEGVITRNRKKAEYTDTAPNLKAGVILTWKL